MLYVGVAAVLTGMVPWQLVNVGAPITHAFLDHNIGWASTIITCGALAGLTSVMLVMLIGQTRVLYAMASDGLLPRKFFGCLPAGFLQAAEAIFEAMQAAQLRDMRGLKGQPRKGSITLRI